MGTQWAGMGRSLMQLPDFRASILRSDAALKETGLVVSQLLMEAGEATFEDTVHAFVGLAAIQVEWTHHAGSGKSEYENGNNSDRPRVVPDRSDRPAQ